MYEVYAANHDAVCSFIKNLKQPLVAQAAHSNVNYLAVARLIGRALIAVDRFLHSGHVIRQGMTSDDVKKQMTKLSR